MSESSKTTAPPQLTEALEQLRNDHLVAYPTETVWGLAALARSARALESLRTWKGRGAQQPISILVSGAAVLPELGFQVDERARALIDRFWPGPLTLVLTCEGGFAPGVARNDGAVGVRCSTHPVARQLVACVEQAGLGPITSTSLNKSGEPGADSLEAARSLCAVSEGEIYLMQLPGAKLRVTGHAAPSTVLDLTADEPQVLRWGAIGETLLQPYLSR